MSEGKNPRDPMVRVCVRRVGSLTGKLAAAPESLTALLALTTKKLKLDREEAQFCIRDSSFGIGYVPSSHPAGRGGRSVGPALRALGGRKSRSVGGVFCALCIT